MLEAVPGHRAAERARLVSGTRTLLARHAVVLAGLVPALAALAICVYDLHQPNVLYGSHEYDDGVYMGAALRFVQGVMPYKDFVIVHPPGIVLLMAPLALVGQVAGSDTAMAMARDLTALVAALNVFLAAWIVRHRGWKASLVAGAALACFPMAPAADSTLLLEPYLVLFCLAGLAVMYRDGRLGSPRRVLAAGVLFGFAGSVKVWAAFVVAALALLCARQVKHALLPLAAGTAAGFAVPCAAFVAMAPGAFFKDVISDQFQRVASGSAGLSWANRIFVLSGLPGITVFDVTAGAAVVAAAALAVFVAAVFGFRRRLVAPADRALLAVAVGAIVPMLVANDIYPHYIYFPAAFVAPLAGCAVAMAIQPRRAPSGSPPRRRTAAALVAAVAALGAFALPQQAGYARSNLASAASSNFLNMLIGPGQCVVSDDPSLLVDADLYRRPPPGCPSVVDPYGTFLASWPGHEPPSLSMGKVPVRVTETGTPPASFVNEWAGWLAHADWVLQLSQVTSYIPWTPQLRAWFARDFHLTTHHRGLWVYRRVARTPPPVAS